MNRRVFARLLSVLALLVASLSVARADEPTISPRPEAPPAAVERERRQTLAPPGRESAKPLSAPDPGASPTSFATLTSSALPLAMVLGLILLSAAVLRKVLRSRAGLSSAMGAGAPSPSGLLEVIGRYPVSRSQALVLLRLDRRVLLLSHSSPSRHHPGEFSTLTEITDPEDMASLLLKTDHAEGASINQKFRAALESADGGDRWPAAEPTKASRRAATSPDGDRTELWDERTTTAKPPGAELFPDPVASLRQKLASLRGSAAGGST